MTTRRRRMTPADKAARAVEALAAADRRLKNLASSLTLAQQALARAQAAYDTAKSRREWLAQSPDLGVGDS